MSGLKAWVGDQPIGSILRLPYSEPTASHAEVLSHREKSAGLPPRSISRLDVGVPRMAIPTSPPRMAPSRELGQCQTFRPNLASYDWFETRRVSGNRDGGVWRVE